jgi:hypothetical protein
VIVKAQELRKPPRPAPQLSSVATQFDTKGFPSEQSDVVALMVLEHQTRVMNLITWLGWESRVGRDGYAVARELADAMVFADEAPISGAIEGSSSFSAAFTRIGPRDHLGRSLREFDLQHRMMKYRCSYMIYSPAFDALPPIAKDQVYERMWEKLKGLDGRAAVEILLDTKRDLPDYFR